MYFASYSLFHLRSSLFDFYQNGQSSSTPAALKERGAFSSRNVCLFSGTPYFLRGKEDDAAESWHLVAIENFQILKRVKDEFEWSGKKGFICLGGFWNVQAVYDWEGLKLEVDETQFDFGTSYEIECESAEPDKEKKLLEDLLTKHGISHEHSMVSKFTIF